MHSMGSTCGASVLVQETRDKVDKWDISHFRAGCASYVRPLGGSGNEGAMMYHRLWGHPCSLHSSVQEDCGSSTFTERNGEFLAVDFE